MTRAELIEIARRSLAERRARDAAFGSDAEAFGEPAWDILLQLYLADDRKNSVPISRLIEGANVPRDIASPYIDWLETKSLMSIDGRDGTLTVKGRVLMAQALSQMAGRPPALRPPTATSSGSDVPSMRVRDWLERLQTVIGDGIEDMFPRNSAVDTLGSKTRIELAVQWQQERQEHERQLADEADLLYSPGWNILLDLFINQNSRKVRITSAAIASGAPYTTALRHIDALEARGLIARFDDPADRRVRVIALSDRGSELIRRVLDNALARGDPHRSA